MIETIDTLERVIKLFLLRNECYCITNQILLEYDKISILSSLKDALSENQGALLTGQGVRKLPVA